MSSSVDAHETARPAGDATQDDPLLIIVMGVSGCGKSTLGANLAAALSLPFLDADDLHPPSNVQKMSDGIPLTDADRAPWLVRVRDEAARAVETDAHGVVIACSALKEAYRAVLRGERIAVAEAPDEDEAAILRTAREAHPDAHPAAGAAGVPDEKHPAEHALRTYFVHPHGPRDVLLARMSHRKEHFMKASMLDSQLATLEDPTTTGEQNVVPVSIEHSPEEQRDSALEQLRQLAAIP
ncbi:carbohydrate kinase [Auriscalpium vulgare]|uniref:Carbohydrate kinase n=1 Tax=Auriscalpium vulgare TaxID=40419 RepID=A0ACB8RUJ9_9AGAM|nr:carbohydrate kinase [Auriscalpium vulgare]